MTDEVIVQSDFLTGAQKLGEKLHGLIPSEWFGDFENLGNTDGTVDRLEVLRWFRRKSLRRMSTVRENNEMPEQSIPDVLVTPSNACIPGGCSDANCKQVFFYDESSHTMREIEE